MPYLGSISAACREERGLISRTVEPVWFAVMTCLHMTSRRPCWWWGTKPFSPLGTKLHFHVNYSRKSIHHFHIDHNAPCLPPKILHNRELFPISPGCYSRPKRNQRQRLRNFCFFGGGGGGGKQSALWSMWKWWIVLTNNVAALSRGCKPRIKIL